VQLRARAQNILLVGAWSAPVTYQVTTVAGNNPQAYPDSTNTVMNQWVDIDVLANDTVQNAATLFVYSVTLPAHGTATINPNNTVRYTPAPGFTGTDQFSYTISDGAAYSDATVTVMVTPPVMLVMPTLNANEFSLLITGPPGAYQVQTSTNLACCWSNVAWVTNTVGSVLFQEQVPTSVRTRFYRALLVQ
jgi:hypothetical protein